MKRYCVVYRVDGIHYRFRCYAKTKAQARKECKESMLCTEIVEVYEED